MKRQKVTNWSQFPSVESSVKSFSSTDQLAKMLLQQNEIIARGNGRCYGDASLGKHIVSTLKYDKILSFDAQAGIFECQSGLILDEILKVIVPKGWFLPVTPGTKFITIGGAVASDVHGKNHHVDGSFSNHVIEIEILLADGRITLCSRNQNDDLFWATCGGMGLTGIITKVKFFLKKIETSYIKQKQVKVKNLEEVIRLFEAYRNYTYSVAWIDCLKKGNNFGRSILWLGEHAMVSDLPSDKQSNPLQLPKDKKVVFPFSLPSFVLNILTVKAFNFFYYEKSRKREVDKIISYEPFFYPLDSILHWNRGYGKKGFVQYQFVLPLQSKGGLIAILNKISEEGMGSFLAVLKIFGQQDDLISFPGEGFTLALDFPIRKGLFGFLDELDEIVLQYGGRLYLSKDARMKPDLFWATYPHASKFFDIVKSYNPDFKINSLLGHRLRISQ